MKKKLWSKIMVIFAKIFTLLDNKYKNNKIIIKMMRIINTIPTNIEEHLGAIK